MNIKKMTTVRRDISNHWVGDGFPVSTMLSYNTMGASISPFLLLDYARPVNFEPSDHQRGVGMHPHRGFETVTIVYKGEVTHKDSVGNNGTIGPGDVQWMTAGRGILHEERHTKAFSQKGGELEMIQLWVNLPAKDKMSPPRYQEIINTAIPVVDLPDQAGTVRIIAGQFGGITGAASTFTPVNLWDMYLNAGSKFRLSLPEGYNTAILILDGNITVNNNELLQNRELALFDQDGCEVLLEAHRGTTLLVMSGEPINEPIVGHGPFVMNTQAEIRQAVDDFNHGRF